MKTKPPEDFVLEISLGFAFGICTHTQPTAMDEDDLRRIWQMLASTAEIAGSATVKIATQSGCLAGTTPAGIRSAVDD
jgi:hypothetical protein